MALQLQTGRSVRLLIANPSALKEAYDHAEREERKHGCLRDRSAGNHAASVFGIGAGEFIVVAIVLLLAVGPDKMPKFMKTVAKGLRDLRAASDELKRQAGLDELLRDDTVRELRTMGRDIKKTVNQSIQEPVKRRMTAADFAEESPAKGVDLDLVERRLSEDHVSDDLAGEPA